MSKQESEEIRSDLFTGENPEDERPTGRNIPKKKSSKTPMIDTYCVDLNKRAEDGLLDPVIGRKKEIDRLALILASKKKNNAILIGEPGVGKTAIGEGLARKIIEGNVPHILLNKRIVSLDLGTMVAGTKYRGQFEERMQGIISEAKENPEIIFLIDEIHTIIGAGGASGSLDAANMVKPALARGEFQCIGATTLDEYREHIEKDGALTRRFKKVMIHSSTPEETIEILSNLKESFEDHHNVTYTDEAIEYCVKLTERYISDRALPDKAFDAMDEAAARTHLQQVTIPPRIKKLEESLKNKKAEKEAVVAKQQYEEAARLREEEKEIQKRIEIEREEWENELKQNRIKVTADDVCEVVSMMTGIPITKISIQESKKLSEMEDNVKSKIIGQDKAVGKLVASIKRGRLGLKDQSKPTGSFIFLGPTGVGKTQLSKEISQQLFGGRENLVRIDMSEYMEKFSVSRLIGSPPGYIGYEKGGQLTEPIRRNPYSVVLFDEIEKAHKDTLNTLLQILDDGHITDGMGRKVDFKNTVIIMTTNVGVTKLKSYGTGVGFNTVNKEESRKKDEEDILKSELERNFAPEFLNRVSEIIVFNSLDKEDISKIVELEVSRMSKRVEDTTGYTISLNKQAKDFICENGYDIEYGARPIGRALERYVEDLVADTIIDNSNLPKGTVFTLTHKKNADKLSIKISK